MRRKHFLIGSLIVLAVAVVLEAQDISATPEQVLPENPAAQFYYKGQTLWPSSEPEVFLNAEGIGITQQEDLLPPPSDPGDLQTSIFLNTASLGQTMRPSVNLFGLKTDDSTTPGFRFGFQARPGVFYDTGFVSSGVLFDPRTIAIDGTPDAHKRGQVFFFDTNNKFESVPLRFQADSQILKFGDFGKLQGYIDLFHSSHNDVRIRHLYGRVVSSEQFDLGFGKTETLFGDLSSVPVVINGVVPIGAVAINNDGTSFKNVQQARLTRSYGDGFEATMSVEEPRPAHIKGIVL